LAVLPFPGLGEKCMKIGHSARGDVIVYFNWVTMGAQRNFKGKTGRWALSLQWDGGMSIGSWPGIHYEKKGWSRKKERQPNTS